MRGGSAPGSCTVRPAATARSALGRCFYRQSRLSRLTIISLFAILRAVKDITFTVAATRQWTKLTRGIRKRIDDKLVRYATGAGDVKSLSGREGACLRVGDWRVIFAENPTTIIVVAVGHRGEIYED
jgi:mRNA interferase RelE/StbE